MEFCGQFHEVYGRRSSSLVLSCTIPYHTTISRGILLCNDFLKNRGKRSHNTQGSRELTRALSIFVAESSAHDLRSKIGRTVAERSYWFPFSVAILEHAVFKIGTCIIFRIIHLIFFLLFLTSRTLSVVCFGSIKLIVGIRVLPVLYCIDHTPMSRMSRAKSYRVRNNEVKSSKGRRIEALPQLAPVLERSLLPLTNSPSARGPKEISSYLYVETHIWCLRSTYKQ